MGLGEPRVMQSVLGQGARGEARPVVVRAGERRALVIQGGLQERPGEPLMLAGTHGVPDHAGVLAWMVAGTVKDRNANRLIQLATMRVKVTARRLKRRFMQAVWPAVRGPGLVREVRGGRGRAPHSVPDRAR